MRLSVATTTSIWCQLGSGTTTCLTRRHIWRYWAAATPIDSFVSSSGGEAREFTKPEVGSPVESLERPQRFLVRKLGKEFLVAVNDIERLEAQGNYVNLHVRGRAYPLLDHVGDRTET
jgi:DNA-binding LytR/AlgR family response regulator